MYEKNVLRGKIPEMPVPQENLGLVLYRVLSQQKKNDIALINDDTGESLSYGDLVENSRRLAQSFMHYRITDAKVIAICSDNHVNYFTVVLGALYMGIPVAFFNPKYTEYELQNAVNITKPDMVFCSRKYCDKLARLKSQNHFVRKIVAIDSNESTTDFDSLEKFINQHSDKELSAIAFSVRRVDIKNHTAFILFSSGTTGLPKGVMLTHLGINSTIACALDSSINSGEFNVTLGVLPFFHTYGLHVAIIFGLYIAKKIIVLEKFEPELYLKNVQNYKITRLATVPPLMQFLLKSELVNKYDLSCVKEIVCGAAPLGRELEKAVKKKFNLRIVRQGYGLSESGLTVAVPPIGDAYSRPGSVGVAYPLILFAIKDVDTGENLGSDQRGEICVKGPQVMKGYYGNEAATRNTFTEDGWLMTGDIGYYDKDGYLYIVDRMKELIKYKGFQVAPAELEQILINNPKIQDVGVVGLPDDDAGELALAYVVKQPNADLTEEDVHHYLAKFVSRNKYLHGGVRFVDEIPRNPSGKILRKELRKWVLYLKSKL